MNAQSYPSRLVAQRFYDSVHRLPDFSRLEAQVPRHYQREFQACISAVRAALDGDDMPGVQTVFPKSRTPRQIEGKDHYGIRRTNCAAGVMVDPKEREVRLQRWHRKTDRPWVRAGIQASGAWERWFHCTSRGSHYIDVQAWDGCAVQAGHIRSGKDDPYAEIARSTAVWVKDGLKSLGFMLIDTRWRRS